MLPILAMALALADASTTPTFRLFHSRTGKEISCAQLTDDLATRDIVFFGEQHDNVVGHQAYAELARLVAERRSDLVISMEMFERDTQGVMNDYLRGRIDEAVFLQHARPWKNYAGDYRPLVELARTRKLDVIAGNLPRSVAAKVASKEGSTSPFLPRRTTAPTDRYRELFDDVMKGHPGADGALDRMYQAQCAKDDAMAEGIADYLNANPHRQPLIIHCNGNFHSDYGLGTAMRTAQRVPLAQQVIVTMIAVPDVAKAEIAGHRNKAHYLLIVPSSKPLPKPKTKLAPTPPGENKPRPAGSK
jgi:uncharacterized iron-regulated protein